jgi:VanZ family protein
MSEAIRSVLVLGAVSLGFWGGVAGRRAGLTGWRLMRAVMAGLLIGVLILALQVFLQPGKASS